MADSAAGQLTRVDVDSEGDDGRYDDLLLQDDTGDGEDLDGEEPETKWWCMFTTNMEEVRPGPSPGMLYMVSKTVLGVMACLTLILVGYRWSEIDGGDKDAAKKAWGGPFLPLLLSEIFVLMAYLFHVVVNVFPRCCPFIAPTPRIAARKGDKKVANAIVFGISIVMMLFGTGKIISALDSRRPGFDPDDGAGAWGCILPWMTIIGTYTALSVYGLAVKADQ